MLSTVAWLLRDSDFGGPKLDQTKKSRPNQPQPVPASPVLTDTHLRSSSANHLLVLGVFLDCFGEFSSFFAQSHDAVACFV